MAFDAVNVREQKVQTLRAMAPMTPEEVARRTVRAQYQAGKIGSSEVPGYRQEPVFRPSRLPRHSRPSSFASRTGAGPACHSSFAPESGWRVR